MPVLSKKQNKSLLKQCYQLSLLYPLVLLFRSLLSKISFSICLFVKSFLALKIAILTNLLDFFFQVRRFLTRKLGILSQVPIAFLKIVNGTLHIFSKSRLRRHKARNKKYTRKKRSIWRVHFQSGGKKEQKDKRQMTLLKTEQTR